MNTDEIIAYYVALDDGAKVLALMAVSHEMTIHGRDAWSGDLSLSEVISRLKAINEIQHHLSAEARQLMKKDSNRYPDEVLVRILFDKAGWGGLQGQLSRCFQVAFFGHQAASP